MNEQLNSNNFFDLSLFTHKKVFDNCKYVWEALNQVEAYLKKQNLGVHQGEISDKAYLINQELISVGIGSVIEPGAYIKGPCIIGNYCTVRHGAYIRGNLITGDHCVIGHDTEVKGSIFLNNSCASHFSYVGDSILGNRVNLGAGVKLANLLFNKQPIKIQVQEKSFETNRRKLGAILADDVQVGCNSVTNPGTLINKKACVYPCINVGGYISAEHSVKAGAELISYPQKMYALS